MLGTVHRQKYEKGPRFIAFIIIVVSHWYFSTNMFQTNFIVSRCTESFILEWTAINFFILKHITEKRNDIAQRRFFQAIFYFKPQGGNRVVEYSRHHNRMTECKLNSTWQWRGILYVSLKSCHALWSPEVLSLTSWQIHITKYACCIFYKACVGGKYV